MFPRQAVILAGGLGTRLGESVREIPKPMMDISGRPFLDYLLRNLKRQQIDRIVLSVGHLHHVITDYCADGHQFGLGITYVIESGPLGTGGALLNCLPHLDGRFFALNGDTMFDVNFATLASTDDNNIMALLPVADASRYGGVILDGNRIAHFSEKGNQGASLVNGGVMCLSRTELSHLPTGRSSLEHDLLPLLAAQKRLVGHISDSFFIDIGLPDSLEEARISIPDWERKAMALANQAFGVESVKSSLRTQP